MYLEKEKETLTESSNYCPVRVVQIIDSKLKLGLHKIKFGKILLQQEGLVIFSIVIRKEEETIEQSK